MNLQKLKEAIENFKNHLKSNRRFDHIYMYESQKTWKNRWDFENIDLKTTYDQSLENSETRRLWIGEHYEPKIVMLKFLDMQKEFVRVMFRDLFDETKEVVGRADRFIYHMDILLEEYKSINRTSIENRHYHDDNYQIISLYLAFEFPEKYAYYDFEVFQIFLKKLGVRDIPKVNDLGRYFKVLNTVYKFLEKDEELMELHRKRLSDRHFSEKSLLLAFECCIVATY